MRQVNRDELADAIQQAMRGFTPTTYRGLRHHDPEERLRWRVMAATIIADKLHRFEVLTSAPIGPAIRYAAIDGISGVPPVEG